MQDNPSSRSLAAWTVQRQFASNADHAAAFLKELMRELKRLDWPEKDRFAIMISMEEALINAVKHGNQHDESKQVEVTVKLDNCEYFARIADEGTGFKLDEIPDPCEDCNLEKTSGRGVALIKNFVDEFSYNEQGNVLEIWKFRAQPLRELTVQLALICKPDINEFLVLFFEQVVAVEDSSWVCLKEKKD